MKVVILDDYQDVVKSLNCFEKLEGHEVTVINKSLDKDIIKSIEDAEVLVLIRERTEITESLLKSLPKLKLISQTGKISKHIDLNICNNFGVSVAEGVGSPVAPSELCWTLIMAASRNLIPYVKNLENDIWQSSGKLGLGRTLKGLNLGIWGYGKIGQKMANYAKAFDMNVVVWGSEKSRLLAKEHGFSAAESKEELFSSADIISLHLRLNQNTKHIVKESDLKIMKEDSLFVNISRSELIEPNALYNSLNLGRPGFATLDVYDSEPVSVSTEKLISLPNVLASPHLGYVERNSYELYFNAAFENINNFHSEQPTNIANPQTFSRRD